MKPAIADPVNRKAKRAFVSLYRRHRLRRLAEARLFTPDFVWFCSINLKERW